MTAAAQQALRRFINYHNTIALNFNYTSYFLILSKDNGDLLFHHTIRIGVQPIDQDHRTHSEQMRSTQIYATE